MTHQHQRNKSGETHDAEVSTRERQLIPANKTRQPPLPNGCAALVAGPIVQNYLYCVNMI